MPRHPLTYIALGWLALLVLAVNAGVPAPDGFGLVIVWLTLASVVYLFVRMCRRWPVFGWLALGFFAGLFGWQRPVYVHTEVTVDDEPRSPFTTTATLPPTTLIAIAAARRTHEKTEMSNALKLFALAQPSPCLRAVEAAIIQGERS